MEELFQNPWFVGSCLVGLITISIVLLCVYLPRVKEIRRLEAIIEHQRETIDWTARRGVHAENEHKKEKEGLIADIGEMSMKILEAQGRENQASTRADQIARGAERMKKGATA